MKSGAHSPCDYKAASACFSGDNVDSIRCYEELKCPAFSSFVERYTSLMNGDLNLMISQPVPLTMLNSAGGNGTPSESGETTQDG